MENESRGVTWALTVSALAALSMEYRYLYQDMYSCTDRGNLLQILRYCLFYSFICLSVANYISYLILLIEYFTYSLVFGNVSQLQNRLKVCYILKINWKKNDDKKNCGLYEWDLEEIGVLKITTTATTKIGLPKIIGSRLRYAIYETG